MLAYDQLNEREQHLVSNVRSRIDMILATADDLIRARMSDIERDARNDWTMLKVLGSVIETKTVNGELQTLEGFVSEILHERMNERHHRHTIALANSNETKRVAAYRPFGSPPKLTDGSK